MQHTHLRHTQATKNGRPCAHTRDFPAHGPRKSRALFRPRERIPSHFDDYRSASKAYDMIACVCSDQCECVRVFAFEYAVCTCVGFVWDLMPVGYTTEQPLAYMCEGLFGVCRHISPLSPLGAGGTSALAQTVTRYVRREGDIESTVRSSPFCVTYVVARNFNYVIVSKIIFLREN